MEYMDNGDLYQATCEKKKKKQYFDEAEIWRILVHSVRGLKKLHGLKILHRDMKSANIFLNKKGEAKLGDLNVSKIAKEGLLYTQTGTPYYASPEVWNEKPYDSKSDIWSLGVVIYEMTALEVPFQAEDMEGLANTIVKGKFNPIPEFYSEDLWKVITLMLELNPTKRPSAQKLCKSSLFKKKCK
jgi:NIMA (never in mitosis gene a)-related kinase